MYSLSFPIGSIFRFLGLPRTHLSKIISTRRTHPSSQIRDVPIVLAALWIPNYKNFLEVRVSRSCVTLEISIYGILICGKKISERTLEGVDKSRHTHSGTIWVCGIVVVLQICAVAPRAVTTWIQVQTHNWSSPGINQVLLVFYNITLCCLFSTLKKCSAFFGRYGLLKFCIWVFIKWLPEESILESEYIMVEVY